MLAFTVFLGVACVVLLVMLSVQDQKDTKLTVENSVMKGRMDVLLEKASKTAVHEEENLTVNGVMESVRFAGYFPELIDNWVRFVAQGELFFINVKSLPMIYILRFYHVDTKEWEMDLLRQAAHQMADELIMVKALLFNEREDGRASLQFIVVSLDRNYYDLRSNLPRYISLIIDGERRLNEIYNQLVNERNDAAQTITPFLLAEQQEKKVMS